MSTTDYAVHPTLEALGDHLKGLATIKLEQTKAQLAFDAEQAEANRIAETRRLEIEAEERIRLDALAGDLKREETAHLAQQQKEPLRDLKGKYPRLFEVCPQLTEEIEALLSSTDLGRDWPHIVEERLKTSKDMSVELDVYEKWIQTDKAGIDSGFFDLGRWGNILRNVSFSDPGHMSKEFAKIQESARSAFKANVKQTREKMVAEANAQHTAQQAIDEVQAILGAEKARIEKQQTRWGEYEAAVARLERLGLRNFLWKFFVVVNAVSMTIPLIWITSDYQAYGALSIWVCTLPVAIFLHFQRHQAPLGELAPTPAFEILAWFICGFLMLFATKGNYLLGIFGVFMGIMCLGLIWHLTTEHKGKRRQQIDWEYSDVVDRVPVRGKVPRRQG